MPKMSYCDTSRLRFKSSLWPGRQRFACSRSIGAGFIVQSKHGCSQWFKLKSKGRRRSLLAVLISTHKQQSGKRNQTKSLPGCYLHVKQICVLGQERLYRMVTHLSATWSRWRLNAMSAEKQNSLVLHRNQPYTLVCDWSNMMRF